MAFTGQISSCTIQKSSAVTIYFVLTSTSRHENYFLSVLTDPSTRSLLGLQTILPPAPWHTTHVDW